MTSYSYRKFSEDFESAIGSFDSFLRMGRFLLRNFRHGKSSFWPPLPLGEKICFAKVGEICGPGDLVQVSANLAMPNNWTKKNSDTV